MIINIRESANVGGKVYQGLDDLDFHIGNEAVRPNYASKWPLRHGIIEDWDLYERFMEQIIFKYLRIVYKSFFDEPFFALPNLSFVNF